MLPPCAVFCNSNYKSGTDWHFIFPRTWAGSKQLPPKVPQGGHQKRIQTGQMSRSWISAGAELTSFKKSRMMSPSLNIRGMQITTARRNHLTPVRAPLLNPPQTLECCRRCEEGEPPPLLLEIQIGDSHSEVMCWSFPTCPALSGRGGS